MKIRQGFVSNSSSSSFICEISGETFSGFDVGLYDAQMVVCENDHTFLDSYLIETPALKEEMENNDDWDYDGRWGVSASSCPICSLNEIPDKAVLEFILKEHNVSRHIVEEIIRERFNSIVELQKYNKG